MCRDRGGDAADPLHESADVPAGPGAGEQGDQPALVSPLGPPGPVRVAELGEEIAGGVVDEVSFRRRQLVTPRTFSSSPEEVLGQVERVCAPSHPVDGVALADGRRLRRRCRHPDEAEEIAQHRRAVPQQLVVADLAIAPGRDAARLARVEDGRSPQGGGGIHGTGGPGPRPRPGAGSQGDRDVPAVAQHMKEFHRGHQALNVRGILRVARRFVEHHRRPRLACQHARVDPLEELGEQRVELVVRPDDAQATAPAAGRALQVDQRAPGAFPGSGEQVEDLELLRRADQRMGAEHGLKPGGAAPRGADDADERRLDGHGARRSATVSKSRARRSTCARREKRAISAGLPW